MLCLAAGRLDSPASADDQARHRCESLRTLPPGFAYLLSQESRERLEACRQKFHEASTVDPEFARAWGYLAYVTMRGVMLGWRPKMEAALAEEYAKRAVMLDPDDYTNYWDLAFVHQCMGRIDLARQEYEKALQLNSNDADLLAEVAEMHVYAGDPQRSIAELRRAMSLNPEVPDWYRWNLAWAYFNARQYQAAVAEIDRIAEMPAHAYLIKAAALEKLKSACRSGKRNPPLPGDKHRL